MTRFLSAIRRLSDIDIVADTVAFIVMALFLAAAFGYLAGATDFVAAWRLGR